MLTSSRPSKHVIHRLHPKAMKDSFYAISRMEQMQRDLKIDTTISPLSPNHQKKRSSLASVPIDSELLRLNVGGVSFRLLPTTILRHSAESLLSNFVFASHDERMQLCTGFLAETKEYFFERSPYLFDSIYNFYVTGTVHKPTNICLDVFVTELTYWNIKKASFAACALDDEHNLEQQDKLFCERDSFCDVPLASVRRQVWNFLEVPESSKAARMFGCFSLLMVLLATGIMVAASIPELQVMTELYGRNHTQLITALEPHPLLKFSELVCMVWFTIEYLTKMAVAAERRKVFWQMLNIVDLIALIPFYIELILEISNVELRTFEELNGALLMMRMLRVSRVIRIFKLGRYSSGLRQFMRTLSRSKKQLSMLAIVLATGVLFFSTLVYNVEKDAPGTQFVSIPAAFWWCIVTMTTVGYGDMYPNTTLGKLIGSGAIACGVLVLALPITIIVDNFMEVHESDISSKRGPGRCKAQPIVQRFMKDVLGEHNKTLGDFVIALGKTCVVPEFDVQDTNNKVLQKNRKTSVRRLSSLAELTMNGGQAGKIANNDIFL